jgi:hypothetical protein
MATRPNPLTVTDELLVHVLDGLDRLTGAVDGLHDTLRGRLPEPQPVPQDPPGTRELREPALPGTGGQPAERREPARPAPDPEPDPEPPRRPSRKTQPAENTTTAAQAPQRGAGSTEPASKPAAAARAKRAAPARKSTGKRGGT